MIRTQMLYLVGCVEETQTEGFLLLPVIHNLQDKAIVQPCSGLHSAQRPASKSYWYKRRSSFDFRFSTMRSSLSLTLSGH